MSRERANPLDLTDFQPTAPVKPRPPTEKVRKVAEAHGFTARSAPRPREQAMSSPAIRQRTARNVQLNLKLSAETVEAFEAVAADQRWKLAETFEHAVEALVAKLNKAK